MEIMYLLLVLISMLCCLFGVLYFYLTQVYVYWKKRGVPFLEPSFPVGNALEMILAKRTTGDVYRDFYRKLSGYKFAGLYQIHRPVLLLMDPDLIKNILIRDFGHFQDHGFPFDETVDPLGANLFMLNGDKWKTLRSKLSPTFTSGRLKMMFQLLVECGQELQKCFAEPANREDILDIREVLARFTTDVIASFAFGIQCNCLSNPDAEFRRWGRKWVEPSFNQKLRDILYFMMPRLAIALGIGNIPYDVSKFFMKVAYETVEYHERNNVTRKDFMQLLIQLKNQGCLDADNQDNGNGQSEYHVKLDNGLDTFNHLVYYSTVQGCGVGTRKFRLLDF
jgi:cytochrome P450 family 6